jgi:hypothetical protein
MVKLKSGKEYEIKGLTFKQRAEIKDLALEYYKRGVPVSLEVCGRAVCFALGIQPGALDSWDDNDVYELGAEVFNQLYLSETDKKK